MADLLDDLLDIIEAKIAAHPRSLQKELGPSEVGNGCDRCLVHLLAGHKRPTNEPWLPTIGTAMHTWLEDAVRMRMKTDPRWAPEAEVQVGFILDEPVIGHSDLFEKTTGTVVDWKLVGKTTLDKVARGDVSITYQRQVQLYGAGFEALGYDVRRVMIAFLPRNNRSLRAGVRAYEAPYDPRIVEETLSRASGLKLGIQLMGVDKMLAMSPPHTGDEFTCHTWPGEVSPDAERQLRGLL